MEVICCICGKKVNISKIHKDYTKLAKNTQGTFVCDLCQKKIKEQIASQKKF